ncbi:histidine kinase [Bacillus sp. TS-2]|nr:histidine kinase [Bacillus sp. TS-2]
MKNKIHSFYSRLKIKHKMILLLTFILFAFSSGGLMVLQYAFHVYNEEIYKQSAQSLSVSSNSIENELIKLERLSFQLTTDIYVQHYLQQLKSSTSNYEQYIIGMDLRKRLLEIGGSEKYINSIQMYDMNGYDYSIGNRQVIMQEERVNQIMSQAKEHKGGARWVFPGDLDPSLLVTREIRAYENISLETIGLLALRINIAELAKDFSKSLEDYSAHLVIFHEGEVVYPLESPISEEKLMVNFAGKSGYHLMDEDREPYFVTYTPAEYTNWTYTIITPFSNLFEAITYVKNAVFIVNIGLFIIILYLSIRLMNGITAPIESLNKKMKIVQSGELDLFVESNKESFYQDETAEMHDNFNVMMRQINELITENYKKQLVIKDSEFKTLQAQINPHFLYNTLESINWTAKIEKQEKISKMAESLGNLLRSTISMKEPIIPLNKELEIVNNYLTIQKYRYEDRLSVETNIPSYLLTIPVPKFVLQPLVENSIRYSLEKRIGHCAIRIVARKAGDFMYLEVTDNGPGIEEGSITQLLRGEISSTGTGLGLKNIHERIQLLFGEKYGIHIISEIEKGTTIQLILPYKEESEDVQCVIG